MSVTAKSLGIDQLEIEDRLALIGEIWDGIADEAETRPLSDAMKLELDTRIADANASPEDSVSWEEVRADAQARLGK